MCASFYDLVAVHYQDNIGCQNGAKPVGNDNTGPSSHDPFKSFLDKGFRFTIEAAGCLIEDENARIFKNDARQGNALFFTSAQTVAALSDNRVIAVI